MSITRNREWRKYGSKHYKSGYRSEKMKEMNLISRKQKSPFFGLIYGIYILE